jgi:hypothetical protein
MNNDSSIIIDPYGNFKFWLYIAPWPNVPSILDFEKKDVRENLIKPNEVVIRDEKITMTITYPLSVEVKLPLEKKGGFTRLDVFKNIYEAYKKIYEEEEKGVGDPGSYANLYNRRKSEGKYGIWGHYLGDLVIESVTYDPNEKVLYMFIGS